MLNVCCADERRKNCHHRDESADGSRSNVASRILRARRVAMRILYPRDDFASRRTVGTRSVADTPANQGCPVRQLLSLHGLSCDCRCRRGGSGTTARGDAEEFGQPVIPKQRRFDMIICRHITVALIALISMGAIFVSPAHAQTN